MEAIRVTTPDGTRLIAVRYTPQGVPRATVVVAPAMGVPQDYYSPFAEFLSQQGFAVMTFDYRGIGASLPKHYRSLRGFPADLYDWAERDYNSVLRAAKAWHPELPLLVVGHSLGGQLPGLLPDNTLIDGMVTVASGSGYWRDNAPRLRRFVWLLWYLVVPVVTPLYGYFPGRKLGVVGDLPKGVIYQWSRWCRSPHYVSDRQGKPVRTGYERIRVPVLGLSFTDDEMMSKRGIEKMLGCYCNADVEHRHIAPHEVDARRIGHLGFFRQQFRTTLWQQVADWLAGRARPAVRVA